MSRSHVPASRACLGRTPKARRRQGPVTRPCARLGAADFQDEPLAAAVEHRSAPIADGQADQRPCSSLRCERNWLQTSRRGLRNPARTDSQWSPREVQERGSSPPQLAGSRSGGGGGGGGGHSSAELADGVDVRKRGRSLQGYGEYPDERDPAPTRRSRHEGCRRHTYAIRARSRRIFRRSWLMFSERTLCTAACSAQCVSSSAQALAAGGLGVAAWFWGRGEEPGPWPRSSSVGAGDDGGSVGVGGAVVTKAKGRRARRSAAEGQKLPVSASSWLANPRAASAPPRLFTISASTATIELRRGSSGLICSSAIASRVSQANQKRRRSPSRPAVGEARLAAPAEPVEQAGAARTTEQAERLGRRDRRQEQAASPSGPRPEVPRRGRPRPARSGQRIDARRERRFPGQSRRRSASTSAPGTPRRRQPSRGICIAASIGAPHVIGAAQIQADHTRFGLMRQIG